MPDHTALARLLSTLDPESAGDVDKAVQGVFELLTESSQLQLLQLQLELAKDATGRASGMFQRCVDILCCETMARALPAKQSWRLYGLACIQQGPANASLLRMANADALASELAQRAGLPEDSLRLHPVHVRGKDAFFMNAARALELCHLVKLRAGLAETTSARPSTVAKLIALDTRLQLVGPAHQINSCKATAQEWSYDQVSLLLHRRSPKQLEEYRKLQQALSCLDEPLVAQYEVNEGQVARAYLIPVSLGLPFSMMRTSLHLADGAQLVLIARNIATEHGCRMEELQVNIAATQEVNGRQAARVALSGPDGALLAGVVEHGVDEFVQYVSAARRMLATAGVHDVTSDTAEFPAVLGARGRHAVRVRAGDWRIADKTIVVASHP